MERRKVLIINEDAEVSSHLSELLPALGYINRIELSHKRGLAWLADGNTPLVTFLNMLSGPSGLTVLGNIQEVAPTAPVIVIGSATELRFIVDALQSGAADYLIVPFDKEQAYLAIQRATGDRRARQLKAADPDSLRDCTFGNPEMIEAFEIAQMVARSDVPVLITGETGVGKDVFARFIQTRSQRASKPSIKINCAALPKDLLESEIFGHERGAFTGADTQKLGKFELAHGGTIFFDEIGELSLALQAKLLHVLHDGEFCRLGGRRPLRVDARIIAATNRKLEEAVSRGEFREDLYFRLDVVRIKVPPLRERKDEIMFLSNYFVKKYGKKYSSPVEELPSDVMQTFLAHDWPGNVRQLENAVKRYLILPGRNLRIADLKESPCPQPLSTPKACDAEPQKALSVAMKEPFFVQDPAQTPHPFPGKFESLKQVSALAAERAEKEIVLWMLEQTNWNRKLAAHRLNICYKALLNKISKWKIRRPPSSSTGTNRGGRSPLALRSSHVTSSTHTVALDHSEQHVERAG